ncbi:MAG: zinc-dependent alcohol dehydrogenase family protein [Dehalococcoidia bacterium]
MRAAVVRSPGPIELDPLRTEDVADPVPAAGEILISVVACGVCRTDLQLCEGDIPPRKLPIIPGHQVVGRVSAVGAGVTQWQAGERVAVAWLGGACGACRFCAGGRENLCESAAFTGWDRDGGYAEKMTARADFALRLPEGFSDIDAAPLLCGGVIGYRALKVSGIEPGGKLGLYGFGASATLAIQVANHWGCEVFVCTRSEREQARALRLGATWAGGYGERPPVPLDSAITFAPSGDVVIAALKSLARGGIVAINAIHLDRIPEFSYDDLWLERQIRSVANFTMADATEFLHLASEIPIRTETEVHPLGEANQALQRLKDGQVSGASVISLA